MPLINVRNLRLFQVFFNDRLTGKREGWDPEGERGCGVWTGGLSLGDGYGGGVP